MNAKVNLNHLQIPRLSLWYLLLIFVFQVLGATFIFGNDNEIAPCPVPENSSAGNYRFLSSEGITSFPFQIFQGDIRFQGEINGHEVYMLLDDGFMWNELLFWGSPRVDSLGLEYDGEFSVRGGKSEENEVPAKTASNVTVRFPGIEFTDQKAIITAYSSGVSDMWSGSVGQVSGTFLKNLIVDINFDEMMITLIEPDKFEYKGNGVEIPWKPMGFGPHSIPASIELADGRSISMDLLMDLGYNEQLHISTIGEHHIDIPEKSVPGILGFNIQGIPSRGYFGRVKQVNIGGYAIKDVVVSYVSKEDSEDKFHEIMIGLGLLSRFNLVFDYQNQRMFVEPNNNFQKPFEYDMSGMLTKLGQGDCLEIVQVFPESPASDAGLKAGDQIARINGKPAAYYNIWDLRSMMRQKGNKINLAVLRGSDEIEVSLTLRRVI